MGIIQGSVTGCFKCHNGLSLPSATKLRRLCFYRRVSVNRGEYLTRYIPPGPGTLPRAGTPPRPGKPPGQVHPPWTRYTLETRYMTPQTRYTPWHQVHPLGPCTPPGTRYTFLRQVHPPPRNRYIPPAGTTHGRYTPLGPGTLPEIWPLLRTVRILLECILVWHIFCRKLHENENNWKGKGCTFHLLPRYANAIGNRTLVLTFQASVRRLDHWKHRHINLIPITRFELKSISLTLKRDEHVIENVTSR